MDHNLAVAFPTRAVTRDGIDSGRVSASSRQVSEEMPRIERGRRSRQFLARERHGGRLYDLEYKRRMWGRPKQTITGLRSFFRDHDLQPGDLITLYKEEGNEVILMGKLISPLYVIDFVRVNGVAGH